MYKYLFEGPKLVESGLEPSLYDLVYKYYRAHVNPDYAKYYTNQYLNKLLNEGNTIDS